MEERVYMVSHDDFDGIGSPIVGGIHFALKDVPFHYTCLPLKKVDKEIKSLIERVSVEGFKNARLYICDVSVNHETADLLDYLYHEGVNVRFLDHHEKNLWMNRYPWASVVTENEGGKQESATYLFYQELTKENGGNGILAEDIIDDRLHDFAFAVREYDTWSWARDEQYGWMAKDLNDLYYLQGQKEFVQSIEHKLRYGADEHMFFTKEESLLLESEKKRIAAYTDEKRKQLVKQEMLIGGTVYRVGILFAEQYISEIGHAIAKENKDLHFVVLINMGEKKLSFRTEKELVNLNEVAGTYGGGGHPKAAGASITMSAFKDFVMGEHLF
ncbi:hypothetical protein IMZ31_22820 (plasmid) [Pontibacillus sp. ALD_SL1]|uniref:DHHA1 domain-containing protein n=1 Tax=Pontibacillus sp. ALD_SL1 TaxID=2777185 RepID=UPI001A961317|nr:DHHA1 domain-containing protein [Pontibacillus sp. ALD_SL1]QST02289.1 hypothetical protein IMZ31_22820 [Pontibacillus sp. ALD_SL1]